MEWGRLSPAVTPLYLLSEGTTGGTRIYANALPMAHDRFTITNPGPTPLTGLTATLLIRYSSATVDRDLKGWGIYAVNLDPATVTGRTITAQSVATGGGTTYNTSQTLILADVPANGSVTSSLSFGITPNGVIGQTNVVNYFMTLVITNGSGHEIRPSMAGGLTAPEGFISY